MSQYRAPILFVVLSALILALVACGGGGNPETAAAPAPTQPPTTAPAMVATEAPEPEPTATAMPAPTATVAPQPAAAATAPPPAATAAPAPAATAAPTPAVDAETAALLQYAAERAGGPGAIFVGDPTQLLGPPPHEALMFGSNEQEYMMGAGAALFGVPQAGIAGHMFIYTSDYYRTLIEKANLTAPTELVSTGESIEVQHVCIDRNLPTCALIQTYYAPNLARRTNGQVKLSVSSFAELGLAGPETMSQVADGSLDMVNIYTGYVSGAYPGLEVQSLWGTVPDWESSYLMLTDMVDDVDEMLLEYSDGSPVLNRNWFAGADQWFFSAEPLQTLEDFEDSQIRTHAVSMSDFIRGMGAQPVELNIGELYVALQVGTIDAATTTALFGIGGRLHEVADYMAGPIVAFGYTHNVINKDLWNDIPEDLQQIMIEEGAKAELEALRLAPFQNVAAVQGNQLLGVQPTPFSPDLHAHIRAVVLPEHVLPEWLNRLGYPDSGADVVEIYNDSVAPYTGLAIAPDGSINQVPITRGPAASP